eukprot:TRINITY_DN12433_c0_g2_i1.p1 TRINITY_DN12433_c0_g2~~TRINITY_DN12433_c0_g2_i1.p1  ORF type:complete len:414 (+),score=49.22 TRINITY_DN12433_c0_g2_i1:202-1443(+)
MSITVHFRTPYNETTAVEVDGWVTMVGLYVLAAEATSVVNGTFDLRFEDEILDKRDTTLTVEGSGMYEDCEVVLVYNPLNVYVAELEDDNVLGRVEVALLKDPEGVLVIDATGVNGELRIHNTPKGVKHIILQCDSASTAITTIAPSFLNCPTLESLDLRSICGVTQVGYNFLANCTSLRTLNLCDLSGVSTIGDSFLRYNASLEEVDLRSLMNVKSIGESFLGGCSSLKSVDLSAMSRLATIGRFFLNDCVNLRTVDLTALTNVTKVGSCFMCACCSMKTVDLRAFKKVVEVGDYFMDRCTMMSSVQLSFDSLCYIGACFMRCCKYLRYIDLRSFGRVRVIGRSFLAHTGLTRVDLRPIRCVTVVDEGVLENCNTLEEVFAVQGSYLVPRLWKRLLEPGEDHSLRYLRFSVY